MLIEVSIGELVDKISILELKQKFIKNPQKREESSKEFKSLLKYSNYITDQLFFYNLLYYVNEQIWFLTNDVKTFEKDFKFLNTLQIMEYSKITNDIFVFNQKRYRLKKIFDMIYSSNKREQKSYSECCCNIVINDEETILDKIAEINYLLLEYDYVLFDSPCIQKINNIFKWPNIINENAKIDLGITATKCIYLEEFQIPEKIRKNYEFLPKKYVSSGALGDFIHQLSVINENFYNTGVKGYLYITDYYSSFNKGPVKTYHDTYDIISKQRYIHTYSMYSKQRFMQNILATNNDDYFDINLSVWRSDTISKSNFNHVPWSVTFQKFFQVEWGKHKWLDVPYDEKWKDCILINTIHYRGTIQNIDFPKIYEKYNNTYKFLFVCNSEEHYKHFVETYKINIECCYLNTFTEICVAIRSCKLFIGALSMFLTIAHACHTPHLIGLNECIEDTVRVSNMDQIIPMAALDIDKLNINL